jgi:hypothetical protein
MNADAEIVCINQPAIIEVGSSHREDCQLRCYFDESAGGQEDEWLAIGGIAVRDRLELDSRWNEMLHDRYPVAPFLHMTDLFTNNDPFEVKAGWTEGRVQSLVNDALELLGAIQTHSYCAFACAIDTRAHKRLVEEGYDIPSPHYLCSEFGLAGLANWATEHHTFELFSLRYDRGEQFARHITRRWQDSVPNGRLVTAEGFGDVFAISSRSRCRRRREFRSPI